MSSQGLNIGVFAASGPVDPTQIEPGLHILASAGHTVVKSPNLLDRVGFLAGPDDDRIKHLHAFIERDDLDVLMAARGGYGLTRILDRLNPHLFEKSQKPIIGFSDVTALHTWLIGHGLTAVHGPVVTQLPKLTSEQVHACLRAMSGYRPPIFADGPVLTSGEAQGLLWGGNLAVLTAMLGTPALKPPPGFILLLEDVGETTYRVDRTLTQLHTSGLLAQAKGIILGDFVACNPAQAGHPELSEVLNERLGRLGIPVLAGAPIGHGSRNYPVTLGTQYHLSTPNMSLTPL